MKPAFSYEILESFLLGKESGFDPYFRLYYKALVFFAKRYVSDDAAAEDIVQECFVKLWENRSKINDEEHLWNWLYRTVYHDCLKWKKRYKEPFDKLRVTRLKEMTESEECEAGYEENIIRAETMRQVREAIEGLPAECRKVFYKLYIEGKTVDETAAELEVTRSTVYNQKARGLKLLRVRLGGTLMVMLMGWQG
ncbi:MAG: RNA polymerase sigma-70 factor [Chitinophagaceae bacterium]|nr:RNA polymerase sigma-70 factor [Chitinophagaceae bacterium]